jgi:hypothetical protein
MKCLHCKDTTHKQAVQHCGRPCVQLCNIQRRYFWSFWVQESIPPAYVTTVFLLFLASIDCSKIPAQYLNPAIDTFPGPKKLRVNDSKELIPPAYVAWRAGTTTLFLLSP